MGPTSMVHAGEAGLTSVVEGMAKVREALPDSIREAADRRLGADSTLGKGVLAMVDTVAEESAKAKATKAALAVEAASARTAAAAAAEEKALALVGSAEAAAKESRGRGGKILLGGLALGAAAGGAYFVWKRRQAAARGAPDRRGRVGHDPCRAGRRCPSSCPAWPTSRARTSSMRTSPTRSTRRPTSSPPSVVEAIEVPADAAHRHVEDAPEPAEPFMPGVADEQSPDVVDENFAAEVDSVADEIATAVVDAIETPEGKQA